MPIYKVTKAGLIKQGTIFEYQIGETIKTDQPITDSTFLSRVAVLNAESQKAEMVNQLAKQPEPEPEPSFVEVDGVEAEDFVDIKVSEVIDEKDVDQIDDLEQLREIAKELGIKGYAISGAQVLKKKIKQAVLDAD